MAKIIKKTVKPVNDEKKELMIEELIEVLDKLGYTVRIEKGIFKGGFCLLREQKLFLLNKNLEQDRKINILVKNIAGDTVGKEAEVFTEISKELIKEINLMNTDISNSSDIVIEI